VWPVGEVHTTVPSGNWRSRHNFTPFQKVFRRWWHRLAQVHFKKVLVSSVSADDIHRSTRASAYTSAMFSETRYAMNGDLRVAYRASPEGERDIVVVSPPFTNCEVFTEPPYIQGWFEAMTSLGRLIFFDQPGIGASDPTTSGAPEPWSSGPTASPRGAHQLKASRRLAACSLSRDRRHVSVGCVRVEGAGRW
jgi:hypothetical protein